MRIAVLRPSELCMSGDSLDLAINRIARANYKHLNYRKALRLARSIHTDNKKLQHDTSQLKALLLQNVGHTAAADSIYRMLLNQNLPDDISYRVHINYAELERLMMDYKSREQHLLMALSLSEGRERNKAIRVLARHYFNVLRDFKSARRMIARHPSEGLTPEGKAGYALLKAQFAEARESYSESVSYYRKADSLAATAGFMAFRYDAVDGAMRASSKMEKMKERGFQLMVFKIVVGVIFTAFMIYNWKTNKPM